MSGRHRKPGHSGTHVAKVAVTGAVLGGGGLTLAGHAGAATDDEWDRVASCESTNNWAINTGNGFQGGLQFTPSTWSSHGGGEYAPSAHMASREQQIAVAERVLANQGRGAWPTCGVSLSGPTQRDVPADPPAEENVETVQDVNPLAAFLPKAPEGWAPFPWELPPAPADLPPPPEDLPPAPEDLPPAPEDLPPAPEDLPPAPEDLPPAPEDLPPAPEDLPPAPEDLPPAPEDAPPAPLGLPKAPEGWAPFPWELPQEQPPVAEDLPPAPEEQPQAPEEQLPGSDDEHPIEGRSVGYMERLSQAIQAEGVSGNDALAGLARLPRLA